MKKLIRRSVNLFFTQIPTDLYICAKCQQKPQVCVGHFEENVYWSQILSSLNSQILQWANRNTWSMIFFYIKIPLTNRFFKSQLIFRNESFKLQNVQFSCMSYVYFSTKGIPSNNQFRYKTSPSLKMKKSDHVRYYSWILYMYILCKKK